MATYQISNLILLLVHGLVSVALLGAVTHQCVAVLWRTDRKAEAGFVRRYTSVAPTGFATAICVLYVSNLLLGALLYPEYRLESRYSLEEMRLLPVVGAFELKEHWGAVGLGLLPLYWSTWRGADNADWTRVMSTLTLGVIVWFAFLVGHVVNNFRGV